MLILKYITFMKKSWKANEVDAKISEDQKVV